MSNLKRYFETIINEGLDKNFLFVTKQKLNNFYFPFFIAQVVEKFKSAHSPEEFAKFYMKEFAKDSYMKENYPEQGQSENTYRNTISAEFFGLIKRNNSQYKSAEPTDAYICLKKYIKNESDVKTKKALIDRQLEKLCLNVNTNSDVYKNVEENSTFITMLFYKVLILLKEKTNDSKLSYNEFLLFLNRAKSYSEYAQIVDYILEYRETEDRYIKDMAAQVLSDNSSKTVRYTQLLEKLHCIDYKSSYFSIKETEYAERYISSTIEVFEKSEYNKPLSKRELIEFLNSDNYFIGKLDSVAIIYSDEKVKDSNNDLSIEEQILEKYEEMDLSDIEQGMGILYDSFVEKFSPKALFAVPDDKLPRYMFYSEKKNKENMCWTLEFHPQMKSYFGSISGGSAYLYGLHFSQKHKEWMTGTSKNQIRLSESEAIERAKEIRQILKDAVDIVGEYNQPLTIDDYSEMHQRLLEIDEEFVNKLWFRKYLHMMFPDLFSTFYNWKWLTYLNKKCRLEQHSDLYELSGELSLLASRVDLPNAIVSKILFELFGYPTEEINVEELDEEENNIEEEIEEMIDDTLCTDYSKEDFLKEVFIDESEYDRLKQLMLYKKNIILQGAPGVGKTFLAKRFAYSILGKKNDSLVEMVQFHQNYSYEDFIMGYKPQEDGTFKLQNGVFYNFCKKAEKYPDKKFFFIIDEINRGNISKIFGELMMLIEGDKRTDKITLAYRKELFGVPENVYLIGLMNTADRSLALLDYALRRRFSFIEIEPAFGKKGFTDYLKTYITDERIINKVNIKIKKLNDFIGDSEKSNLGKGFKVGHSYFCVKPVEGQTDTEWYKNIIEFEVLPLLDEYWWDDEDKVEEWKTELLEN